VAVLPGIKIDFARSLTWASDPLTTQTFRMGVDQMVQPSAFVWKPLDSEGLVARGSKVSIGQVRSPSPIVALIISSFISRECRNVAGPLERLWCRISSDDSRSCRAEQNTGELMLGSRISCLRRQVYVDSSASTSNLDARRQLLQQNLDMDGCSPVVEMNFRFEVTPKPWEPWEGH
jgi:hypothetical protein